MIDRVLRSCLVYCMIWSVLSILFYLILDRFGLLTMHGYSFTLKTYLSLIVTQFRLTFWLTYFFLSGEFILNRIFSEREKNMEHCPYIVVPNNASVDVTIFALNRTPQKTRNVEYFWVCFCFAPLFVLFLTKLVKKKKQNNNFAKQNFIVFEFNGIIESL